MITREIVVTLPGTPAPKGSLKCIGQRGQVKHTLIEDATPNQKMWRSSLVTAFKQATQRGAKGQAIGVEASLTLDRPAAHYGTGRNARRLKQTAPQHPTGHGTNDIDKMLRLTLDALQDAGILDDDCQVTMATGRKGYVVAEPAELQGPKPPAWAASYRPNPDLLPYPGGRVRVWPYEGD